MQLHYTQDLDKNLPFTDWPGFSRGFRQEMGNGKFYLVEKTDNVYRKIRKIGKEEIYQINAAHKVLHDFLFFLRKNAELNTNFRECLDKFDAYEREIKNLKTRDINKKEIELEIYVEINYSVPN